MVEIKILMFAIVSNMMNNVVVLAINTKVVLQVHVIGITILMHVNVEYLNNNISSISGCKKLHPLASYSHLRS